MKMAEQSQVNQPFGDCLSDRLEGFKDTKYVKEVCQKFFGEDVSIFIICNLTCYIY